jgi:hypothetical protein
MLLRTIYLPISIKPRTMFTSHAYQPLAILGELIFL